MNRNLQTRIVFYWAVRDSSYRNWFSEEIEYLRENPNIDLRIYCCPDPNPVPLTSSEKISSSSSSSSSSDAEKEAKHEVSSQYSYEKYEQLNVHDEVLTTIMANDGDTAVFCCGPEGINLGARNAVISSLSQQSNYVDYYEESFSW
ncbi:hypothetical protein FF38_08097 [Lucilia cuprina]|uniref:Ferric reductase NAD binding domain-containing protein n=1 Tax=Lucilia cuprina TaxID=7375 RepID=A0A0L0BYL0_LUCCU|nr:hypothetical protein FF38_08097 [Lucilia cuprina]